MKILTGIAPNLDSDVKKEDTVKEKEKAPILNKKPNDKTKQDAQ